MIAKKHAQSYMPNGEVSLEQVIQAAIDEAIAAYVNYPEYRDKNELQERIRQLGYDKKIYLARAEASEADYARVVGRNRQLEAERVPEGWKLVPIDPTPAMINAARWDEFQDEGDIRMTPVSDDVVAGLWADMLAALPQQKEGA